MLLCPLWSHTRSNPNLEASHVAVFPEHPRLQQGPLHRTTPIATSWCGNSCGWCLLSPSRLLGQRLQHIQQAVLCDTLVEGLVALQSAACVKVEEVPLGLHVC